VVDAGGRAFSKSILRGVSREEEEEEEEEE
jgi:hypothetical protein